MSWYKTATVSVTSGSATVTANSGANFSLTTMPGDLFSVDKSRFYEVLSVAEGGATLTLAENFAGATNAAATYVIVPLSQVTITTAGLANKVSDLLVRWQNREAEYANWAGGTVNGGPNGNGTYPLTDALGNMAYVACPAKQQSLLAADTLDAYHASMTPVASQIPVLDANKALVLPTVGFLKGDFGNATPASRTLVQSSVANNSTLLSVVPNGTGTDAGVEAYSAAAAANCSVLDMRVGATTADINSKKIGSGSARPLRLLIDGTEHVRLLTDGTVGLGTATPGGSKLNVTASTQTTNDSGALAVSDAYTVAVSDAHGIKTQHNAAHTAGTITNFNAVRARATSQGAGGTTTNLRGVLAEVQHSAGTVTNAIGVGVSDIAIAGATVKGVESNISSGTNKWNVYAGGTAINHFSGNVLMGTTTSDGASKLQVLGATSTTSLKVSDTMATGGAAAPGIAAWFRNTNLTGTTQYGVVSEITATAAATASLYGFLTSLSTATGSQTTGTAVSFHAANIAKGAGSSITTQVGVNVMDLTTGGTNYGIRSLVSAGANKWNLYIGGTAINYLAGNTLIGTTTDDGVNKLQVAGTMTASQGIQFPAAAYNNTNANTLDDYEEGTFTPVVAGSTTAGTQTYSVQNGHYVKIGKIVNFWLQVAMSAKDAATAGNVIITGLPFTAHGFNSAMSIHWIANVTLGTNKTQIGCINIGPSSQLSLTEFQTGSAATYLQATSLSATSGFIISGSYQV